MTDTIAAVSNHIDTRLTETQTELDAARRKIAQMEADVRHLNEMMNEEATDRDWCADYDDQIEVWNGKLTVLQLTSRRKPFVVAVKLTLTYETYVEVQAHNESAARDRVGDFDTQELLNEVSLSLHDYDESDFSITSSRPGTI